MKTSHKSTQKCLYKIYKIIAGHFCNFVSLVFILIFFVGFTSSNFYFVGKVGVKSGTPAPAREGPAHFHVLAGMITGMGECLS